MYEWGEISQLYHGSSLLLGNGMSVAVWQEFRYRSLFENSCIGDVDERLDEQSQQLFRRLNTDNFEHVLATLANSRIVAEIEGIDFATIDNRYRQIASALASAVRAVHPPSYMIADDQFEAIADSLAEYSSIFSTNYDLLVYWSINKNLDRYRFVDRFFDGRTFDPNNTRLRYNNQIPVLFLHGALHLYENEEGVTCKHVAGEWNNLLDQITNMSTRHHPLFITEGDAASKLSAIFQSKYLTFCYNELRASEGSMVLFGHSLGDSDNHLAAAIRESAVQRVAVAVHVSQDENEDDITFKTARIRQKLRGKQVDFFTSVSHPLGSDELDAFRNNDPANQFAPFEG